MTPDASTDESGFEHRVAARLRARADSIDIVSREDDVVAVGPRPLQRKGSHRRMFAAAAMALVVFGLAGWVVVSNRADRGSTVDSVAVGEDGSAVTSRQTVPGSDVPVDTVPASAIEPPGVELQLLAVRSRPLEFAVIDLQTGLTRVTGIDDHAMGAGFASGASISPRGDALVWRDGVYVFSGTDMTSTPTVLEPSEWRIVPSLASELHVVPTSDGESVWVSQHAYYWNDAAVPAVIDLIDVDTGEVRTTVEIEETIGLAGAAGDSLVVTAWPPVQVDGKWIPDYSAPRVLLIAPDGSVRSLRDGSATAAWDDRVAGIVEDELVIDQITTGGVRVEVERPDGFRWVASGGPLIPSTAQPLPQVSRAGELLMYLVELDGPTEPDGFPAEGHLVAVSLLDGDVRHLGVADGLPVPTWSRDGSRVATLSHGEIALVPDVDDEPTVLLPVPDDFFVLGAG